VATQQPSETGSNGYTVNMARTVPTRRYPPPPEVMTIDDLATYLQVSKSSLYKLAQDGRVPGKKVGRHWRFHKDAIESWLKDPHTRGKRS
jgi:excisionase family DNA binding protein